MKTKSGVIEFFINSLEQGLFLHLLGLSQNHDILQEVLHIQM